MSATMPWTETTYYRMEDIFAATGAVPEETFLSDGLLLLRNTDQAVLDAALPTLDPLGQLRVAAIARVRLACQEAIVQGVAYQDLIIPTGQIDQLNLAALCLSAVNDKTASVENEYKMWAKDGGWTRKTFSGDQLIEIGKAVIFHIQQLQAKYETLMLSALAATTAEELLAIVW